MLSISFKELFWAEFYHESPLSPFPLMKNPEQIDQKFHHISVEWFSQSENGTFVSSLPTKDLFKYDLRKHLCLKACQLRLFIDLPQLSLDPSNSLKRKNILSSEQTIQKIGEQSDDEQENLARTLLAFATEIGLSSLSFDDFRLTKGDNNWALVAFEPKIFQNPQILHSRETTQRFLATSLMKSLSNPYPDNPIDLKKLQPQSPRLAPFFSELKKIHEESRRLSITKIFLSIVSCGFLPLYYLMKCCWKFYQITRLKKKLLKLTFGKNPYTERAEKMLDCCIKMTQQVGSAGLAMQNRRMVEL